MWVSWQRDALGATSLVIWTDHLKTEELFESVIYSFLVAPPELHLLGFVNLLSVTETGSGWEVFL